MNISRNESKIFYSSFYTSHETVEHYYRETKERGEKEEEKGKGGRNGETIPRYLTGPPLFRFLILSF